MTAQDYPITFPYGATDDTYYGPQAQSKSTYIGRYHRGDDRYMPIGTPVVVNGLQIGLSGATGAVSGPHLHIGKFESGVDVNPKGVGFTIPQPAHVQAIGEDPVDGKYVQIVDATAMLWCYLHLSEIDVTERQLIKEGGVMPTKPSAAEVRSAWTQYAMGPITDEQVAYYTAKTWDGLLNDILADVWTRLKNTGSGLQADPDGVAFRSFKKSLGL